MSVIVQPMRELFNLIAHIVGWILARPAIRVRLIADDTDVEVGGLRFEVENQRDKPTSLEPQITATYLTVKRQPGFVTFDVRELDRGLPPFAPKLFSASASEYQPGRFHSWFRVYRFASTRGRICRVRIKNASLEPMGLPKFWFQRVAFTFSLIIGAKTSMTIDEYHAKERARGPH
ncbi:MAG: hypothetical protein ACRD3W_30175 [Terriglobales bacterium]